MQTEKTRLTARRRPGQPQTQATMTGIYGHQQTVATAMAASRVYPAYRLQTNVIPRCDRHRYLQRYYVNVYGDGPSYFGG
jgi:hypothetical protein